MVESKLYQLFTDNRYQDIKNIIYRYKYLSEQNYEKVKFNIILKELLRNTYLLKNDIENSSGNYQYVDNNDLYQNYDDNYIWNEIEHRKYHKVKHIEYSGLK
jgi:hypothetical protein